MIHFRLYAALLLAVLGADSGAAHAQAPALPCEVDRARLLALDQNKFDQDLTGGWRALAAKPGCELAAADLVRDYRQAHNLDDVILYWHEGQLRAGAGQTDEAAALMARSYRTSGSAFGWNEYVDASVAFLRRDRAAFDDAWRRLASLPPAAGVKDGYREMLMDDGSKRKVRWPMNIGVVEGLSRCFDKPYREAYGSGCRSPIPLAAP